MSINKIKVRLFSWIALMLLFASAAFSAEPFRIEAVQVIHLRDAAALPGDAPTREPVITALAMDAGHSLLLVAGDDHSVRCWDLVKNRFIWSDKKHEDWVRGAAVSPDAKTFVTVDHSGLIMIGDAQSGERRHALKQENRGARRVVISPGKDLFAVCGTDQTVSCYSAATGNRLSTFRAPGESNRALAFSTNGQWLAVAGRNGIIRLWDVAAQKLLRDFSGDGRRVNAVAFSADGKRLAAAGEGIAVTVYDTTNGNVAMQFPERPGKTFSLAFCGNDYLASGESDNAIRLWNLANGTETANMIGHTGTVAEMVFDAQNGQLVSGGFDTTIRFWPIPK